MEQNFRELGLQSIIKSLQIKVGKLNEELKMGEDRESKRESQLRARYEAALKEKNTEIIALKERLSGVPKSIDGSEALRVQINTLKARCKELEGRTKELESRGKEFEGRCKELEAIEKEDTLKMKELMELNRKLIEEVKRAQTSEEQMERQFQGLSRLRIQIEPEREQTLAWVDNLIIFIEKADRKLQASDKHRAQIEEELSGLRVDINELNLQAETADQKLRKELTGSVQALGQVIEESLKRVQLGDLEKLWETARKEKEIIIRDETSQLKAEYSRLKAQLQSQAEEAHAEVRALENEKKSLVAGFQELKALFQNREKIYKEEIALLKQSLANLVDLAQKREEKLQVQLRELSEKVYSLEKKYITNAGTSNLSEIKRTLEDPMLKGIIAELQANLDLYLSRDEQNRRLYGQLGEYLSKSEEAIELVEAFFSIDVESGLKSMEMEITMAELKERDAKNQYEINLLKKQNAKLAEMAKGAKHSRISSQGVSVEMSVEMSRMSEENLALKQLTEKSRALAQTEIRQVRESLQQYQMRSRMALQNASMLYKSINNLKQAQEEMLISLTANKTLFHNMRTSLLSISKIFSGPVQSLEVLLENAEVVAIEATPEYVSSMPREEIREYRALLKTRADNGNAIIRTMSEMIRVTREGGSSKKRDFQPELLEPQKTQSRASALDKRIRQDYLQRIQHRQEITAILDKMKAVLKGFEDRLSHGKRTNKHLDKLLEKKIEHLSKLTSVQKPLELSEVTKEALRDLKNKLKNAHLEQQKLTEELLYLKKAGKQ